MSFLVWWLPTLYFLGYFYSARRLASWWWYFKGRDLGLATRPGSVGFGLLAATIWPLIYLGYMGHHGWLIADKGSFISWWLKDKPEVEDIQARIRALENELDIGK